RRVYARRLLPMIDRLDEGEPSPRWQHGYCPVCGGWPLVAELRGSAHVWILRCGAGGAGWETKSPCCPYFGNVDAPSLRSLAVCDEGRFGISACDRCKGYLKVDRAVDVMPAEQLALDDLATARLDVAAVAAGYHRPAGSGFVVELAIPEEEWIEELG